MFFFFYSGIWNVPYMTGVYLVQAHVLPTVRNGYDSDSLDPDMAFCKTLREKVQTQSVFILMNI